MPRVTYVDNHGDAREVEVAIGHTVMEGAFRTAFPASKRSVAARVRAPRVIATSMKRGLRASLRRRAKSSKC
jgi:hypothetical protein